MTSLPLMTVLSHSPPSRSSRFAYTVAVGPLDFDHPDVIDLGTFSATSTTFSFVSLRFAPVSDYAPVNLPVVLALLTIPDNGSGVLAYQPHLHVSTQNDIGQFYAPPDDLFACFAVTVHRGAFLVPFPFVLPPSAHLVLVVTLPARPTQGNVFLQGTVSSNVSYG